MGTLNEDLSAIKAVEDTIIVNKVANFAYTDEAYAQNDANGVTEYNVDNAQNIPTADPSVLKVNDTVLSKGYRAQASSITRMLMNHFLGRLSYNVNKVNDGFSNLVATLIAHRGTADGFATLDANGRIPYSQLPESAMEYKGQWNAETNTPTLANETGTKGDFYIVSVAGTHNFGSGDIQFFVNDRVIYDGSVWSRLSAGDVKTVNNISPVNGNIPLTGENIPVSSTDPTLLSAPLITDRYADSSVTEEKIADNAVTNAKIKDPISVAKGGTGATDAKNGFTSLANGLTQSQNPQDAEYMIYKSGGSWGLYTFLQFWEYLKAKISSVLRLTETQYNGNANTATKLATTRVLNIQDASGTNTGTGANFDGSGNATIKLPSTIKASITGDCSGSSGSCTGNSATATNAYNAYRGTIHVCESDSTESEKIVSVTGFALTTGACIRVLFEFGNSVRNPTLNVNGTGAREIRARQKREGQSDVYVQLSLENGSWGSGACIWQNKTLLELYYDGTYWIVVGNPIVNEKISYNRGTASYRVFIDGKKEIWGEVNIPTDIGVDAQGSVVLDTGLTSDNSAHSVSTNANITNTLLVAYGEFIPSGSYHSTISFKYRNVGNEIARDPSYITGRAEGY